MVESSSKLIEPINRLNDDDDDDDEKEEELKQEQLDDFLLKACKENNVDDVAYWLAKHASPTFEKDGWNPLLWAANNGSEEIIRILIKHNACAPYLNSSTGAGLGGNHQDGTVNPM